MPPPSRKGFTEVKNLLQIWWNPQQRISEVCNWLSPSWDSEKAFLWSLLRKTGLLGAWVILIFSMDWQEDYLANVFSLSESSSAIRFPSPSPSFLILHPSHVDALCLPSASPPVSSCLLQRLIPSSQDFLPRTCSDWSSPCLQDVGHRSTFNLNASRPQH